MINLYIAPSSASSRKARAWLKEHDIAFQERNIKSKPLNAAEVKQILRLTENGSEDIISTRSKFSSNSTSTSIVCQLVN
jgi:Arsenate reductase and related proteins, glutaredoxin family